MLVSDNLTYADLFKLLEKAQAQLGRQINPTFYSQNEWKRKLKAGNNFVAQVIEQPKIFLTHIMKKRLKNYIYERLPNLMTL